MVVTTDPNHLKFPKTTEITLRSGTGAQIAPIVSASGEIITVIIISKGKDYTTTPKITIESALVKEQS